MAGWESPQNVQWTQGCSISFKQFKIQINIRQVTYHYEGLDAAAIPDTFLQPPLNYSPLHSIFAENASAKLSIPPLGSEWDFMDGHDDDFSLLDWTPARVVHLPQHSDPQIKPLLDNASECSFLSPVNASSNPMILQTDVDFDDMLDLKDLNIFDSTTITNVHPHEKPDTVLQPLGCNSCYMYNSLEDVDLNYLWHNTDMNMQQTSVNVTSTCSNLLVSFEHESITAPVSGHMDKPEGEPLLPSTSERVIYHSQTPGMPSNCTQPFQTMGSCNHPRVANVNPGQFGELHRHGRTLRDVVNSRVSPPLYGSAQYSQAWPVNPNINRQPVPTANRQPLNMLHPQEIQAGSASTQGQRLLRNSGFICNQPMMGKLVAGVSRVAAPSAPQNTEVVILEEIQPIKSQKSADPVATGQTFNQVPQPVHQSLLGNASTYSVKSAVNARPTSSTGTQPASKSVPSHGQLLPVTSETIIYMHEIHGMPPSYTEPYQIVAPIGHLHDANMKGTHLRKQLPQEGMLQHPLNLHASTPLFRPGPAHLTETWQANMTINHHRQPRSTGNWQMCSKPHPEDIPAEDILTQGQTVPCKRESTFSVSNQHLKEKLESVERSIPGHQAAQKEESVKVERSQSAHSQTSGAPAADNRKVETDSKGTGVPPMHNRGGINDNCPTATSSRQKKACTTQHGDKPALSVQLEKEASVTAEPIKQTDFLSVAKTHLNMRMRESGQVSQEFGDKPEQGILKQKSDIPTRKVIGNNVCTPKPVQNINKMNISGENPLAHHSNHTGKSATKRKNSDSKSQVPRKMKTQVCAPDTLLAKKQCITAGHEMCNSDMPPVNTAKDIEKPKRGSKRKRHCKTAAQPCFKHPRSDLTVHMLASVEVFHKLGDRGKGAKSAHVLERRTLPASP